MNPLLPAYTDVVLSYCAVVMYGVLCACQKCMELSSEPLVRTVAYVMQEHVVIPLSKADFYTGEPRSLAEAWSAGDFAVYPYAKSLATKTSISGLVIQKEWVQPLMEPNGKTLLYPLYCMSSLSCAVLLHCSCEVHARLSNLQG